MLSSQPRYDWHGQMLQAFGVTTDQQNQNDLPAIEETRQVRSDSRDMGGGEGNLLLDFGATEFASTSMKVEVEKFDEESY